MNFSGYIAQRYLRSTSKNNAINIINGIASVGIVVGVAVLFFALSIFSGLIDFSLSFTNAIDSDLKITPKTGKSFLVTQVQLQDLKKTEGIKVFSRVAEERVLFSFNNKDQVTYLKGVDSVFIQVSNIKGSVFNKEWLEPNTCQVVLGAGTADKLGLGLFDVNNSLEVFVPKSGSGTIENPEDAFNKAKLVPVGVYSINEDYDSKYVFTDLTFSQVLLGFLPNQVTAIEVKLLPNASETDVTEKIQKLFNNKIIIKNKAQQNDALYKMLNTENFALYLILTLVLIIVLFNLIGALTMMILEKKKNLKTLYNLGTEIRDLRRIFLYQGTLLCFFGGILGLIIGIFLVVVQQHFSFLMITETLPYPVKFTVKNVLIVIVTLVPLGIIASLIASGRINKKLLE